MENTHLSIRAFILSPNRNMRSPNLLPSLDALGISYEVVDKSNVENTLLYLESIKVEFPTVASFTPEQLACTYGHLLMHQRAIEVGAQWTLFFENDATLDIALLRVILDSLDSLPKGIFLLGSCGGWAKRHATLKLDGTNVHRVLNSAVTGSHAYFVKTEYIPNMISEESALTSLADEFVRKNLPMYITVPFVSYQEGFTPSQIPLSSKGFRRGRGRSLLSSLKADILDLMRLGRLGNRCLRLDFLEIYISKFLMKLQGCNLFHISQSGSTKDHSESIKS